MASAFGLSRCASCSLYFISNSHKCRSRVEPAWHFGRPNSDSFSWLFVPLIRCALGLEPADEAICSLPGLRAPRWNSWVAAYREDFKSRNITPSSLPFGPDGYLDHTHQVRLLLGPAASGESNVLDAIEGDMTLWASATQSSWRPPPQPRRGPRSHYIPPRGPAAPAPASSSSSPSCSSSSSASSSSPAENSARLSPAALAEHQRLWPFLPHAAATDWVAACLPRFAAFIDAHSANNHHARGLALDAILLAPAQFLVRKGGGWNCRKAAVKLQQHIRSLLAQGPLPRPSPHARGVPADVPAPDVAWKRKLLRSAELASRGQWRRAAQVLSRPDFVPPSAVSCEALRAKQTSSDTAIPAFPPDTPRIIIDPDVLVRVIRGSADGRTGGPSGWTAELMLPLWDNEVCKQGICLLTELISNDDLDPHSRLLLTSSVLFGIPKKNSDVRPLAIGDEFLKLAERVCLGLVRPNLGGMFEPVQLGISPSGPERAIQILQAALEANPEHVATHVDLVNMFNSCDRGLALAEAYADPLLAGVRRVFSFAYSTPSPLLVRDRGVVVDSFLSSNGGRQGDCLAGLLCARFFQPVYTACLAGLPSLTACAIMDDFSFVGDPAECLIAFERLRRLARERGVEVHPDSCLQVPRGEPSEALAGAAAAQGLRVVRGNTDYLGGALGLDDAGLEAWVREKLAALSPVERAITDDDLPALHAIRFAKMNLHPMPTYISRALPFRVSAGPVGEFGDRVRDAVLRRLHLPQPLPDSAIISLSQPSRNGGMGMRSWRSVGPAAKFASAAIVAPDLLPFAAVSPPLPFVRDRDHCYALLVRGGVEVQGYGDDDAADHKAPSDDPHACPHYTLPADPADIATHFQGECRVRGLQRSLTKQLDDYALQRFRTSLGCAPLDHVRLSCCSRSRDQPLVGA